MRQQLATGVLVAVVLGMTGTALAQTTRGALEGAVGFGTDTKAGQAGKIVRVTSLAGKGPGSLREALSVAEPRIVVFEVGGVMDLEGEDLEIREPMVLVAGQTAPGPGITIVKGSLRIAASDVVLQHVRVRPGDMGKPKKSGFSPDGIALGNASGKPGVRRVVVDHCSATWAVDENLTASGPRHEGREGTSGEVTFSNCIIAEGLSQATHEKGEHSMGTLIHDHVRNVSIIGNLYAHNMNRNPVLKPDASAVVVNNLIYNPGAKAMHSYWNMNEWRDRPDKPVPPTLVAVNNVLWHGPSTPANLAMIFMQADKGEVFSEGNTVRTREGGAGTVVAGKPVMLKEKPLWPEGLEPLATDKVAEAVLSKVGAWPRDEVDARIVASVRDGKGKVIDSQEEVGGYPKYKEVRRPLEVPADDGKLDQHGRTRIGAWLDELARQVMTTK